jgi:hypothetical protein
MCLLITAAGCGAGGSGGLASVDGGPVGTGISASVSGNVSAVAPGSAAADSSGMGASMMPAVRVTIDEVPGIGSTTDADGNFQIEGTFSGNLTLRFSTPMFAVVQRLDVPAGSTIVLEDVQLASGMMVQMGAVRQLGFLGTVAHTDCSGSAGDLLVNDRRPTADQFMVRLSAATTILGGNGQALQCAAVATGQQVIVRGTIQPADQTVVALAVIVAPQPTAQVQFTGTVMMINCDSGMLMVSDPTDTSGMPVMPGMPGMSGMSGMPGMVGRSRVRLLPAMQITDSRGQPLQCQNIRPGDHVEVGGVINSDNPGVVGAQVMTVSTVP